MKPMQSLSTQQYFTLSQVKNMSADNKYKRYPNHKLLTQQSLCSTNPHRNNKTITPVITKNNSLIHQVTRSEQLINLHSDFKEQMQRQNSVFKSKWSQKDSEVNIRNLKEASNDMLAKRSMQIMIGIQKGATKTQYSKINRRKEQILKKCALSEKEERKDHPIHKFDDFSEQKLLEKYREMILRKEQGMKSFNMINKLYQIDAMGSNEVVRSHKQAMKIIPTKSYQTRKNSQLEYKISKIIQKPAELKVVKEMLAFQHDNGVKDSFRQQKEQQRVLVRRPQSQEKKNEKRNSSVKVKRQTGQRIEPSTPKIAQLRGKSNMNHKMQVLKNSSPVKHQTKTPLKSESVAQVKTEGQILYPPPKKVTATAYIIYEILENNKVKCTPKRAQFDHIKKKDYPGKIHSSLNIKNSSQIASLTKIMTCIVVIETCQKLSINPHTEKYKVGSFESFIKGTTAQIEVGDIYTIDQLLKGLMLPSGNDASLALARWAGNILLLTDPSVKGKVQGPEGDPQTWASGNRYLRYKSEKLKPKRCYNRFIAEMNKKSRLLGLERTSYMNSHGLSDPHNKSCCIDLAILCQYALQNKYFCQIVSCKECKATIDREEVISSSPKAKRGRMSRRKINREDPEQDNLEYDVQADQVWNKSDEQDNDDDESEYDGPTLSMKTPSKQQKIVQISTKQIHWINTHRLLQDKEGYHGIKTGVTVTAGPCLASYYKLQQRKFIIVVLNSKKLSQRFVDTEILRQWLCKKERIGVCSSKIQKYS